MQGGGAGTEEDEEVEQEHDDDDVVDDKDDDEDTSKLQTNSCKIPPPFISGSFSPGINVETRHNLR